MERTFAPARNTATPTKPPRLLRLVTLLLTWEQRSRTRRHLAELDAIHLSDTGITWAQREQELAKPFWKE